MPVKTTKPKPAVIAEGSIVRVTTEYTVRRIIDGGGATVLVGCVDKYADRVVNFRKEELEIVR
jgi:hypothetical protein